jgi:hypothetical protein
MQDADKISGRGRRGMRQGLRLQDLFSLFHHLLQLGDENTVGLEDLE